MLGIKQNKQFRISYTLKTSRIMLRNATKNLRSENMMKLKSLKSMIRFLNLQ